MPITTEQIAQALAAVRNKRLNTDVFTAQQVGDLAIGDDDRIRLTLLLAPEDDATLVREVREALQQIEGVADVRVDVRDPSQRWAGEDKAADSAANPGPAAASGGRSLPVINTGHGGHGHGHGHGGHAARRAPGAGTAAGAGAREPREGVPNPVRYPQLGTIIAVSSGKGGVGKSTVAVNLAISLARAGKRVGIMDADVYGPNLPLMMGVDRAPAVRDDKIVPLEAWGVKVVSLGFLIEKDQPAIWRGPIVMKLITQFLRDVHWEQLDYFLVDMPPGTGDAQLSLVQATQVHGAVIVTTPQQLAIGDALRGVKMFERTGVPVLGIVENMSWFENPETGKPIAIFGSGGGQRLADECRLPLIGQIPLDPRIQEGGDTGKPIVGVDPGSPSAKALIDMSQRVMERLEHYGR